MGSNNYENHIPADLVGKICSQALLVGMEMQFKRNAFDQPKHPGFSGTQLIGTEHFDGFYLIKSTKKQNRFARYFKRLYRAIKGE